MAGNLNQLPRKTSKPERIEFRATPDFKLSLFQAANAIGLDASEYARQAVIEKLSGKKAIVAADPGLNTVRVAAIAVAPCGPFKEAIAQADSFVTLSPDVAQELWFADGDVFVTARGDSMRSAGIIDGQRVLMTPLASHQAPRRGDIVLVQIVRDGEVYEATIKRWDGLGNDGRAKLLDGNDKPVKLPAGTEKVIPVAIGKSVMGRL